MALATRLPDGAQCLLPDASAPQAVQARAAEVVAGEHPETVLAEDAEWFIQVFQPPARLLIVGAVHVAQALAPAAALLDYAVAVCDPRTAFATAARFGDVRLIDAWPDEAVDAFAPDGRTAIVTLSHDPKLDDPALDRALRTRAFFIGALGSRRTHEALRQAGIASVTAARLETDDVSEDEAARRIGAALAVEGLSATQAATGRVNLVAERAGLLGVDAALVRALNAVSEEVTLATRPDNGRVAAGEIVATIKIIPFAVSAERLDRCLAMLAAGVAMRVRGWRPLRVGLGGPGCHTCTHA